MADFIDLDAPIEEKDIVRKTTIGHASFVRTNPMVSPANHLSSTLKAAKG